MYNFQEAIVVKLRLKNTALKVQKRKLLQQLRQACTIRLILTCCSSVSFYRAMACMRHTVLKGLSVCLSNTCFLTKRKIHVPTFFCHLFIFVSWQEEWLVGATPSTRNFGWYGPCWSQNGRFSIDIRS